MRHFERFVAWRYLRESAGSQRRRWWPMLMGLALVAVGVGLQVAATFVEAPDPFDLLEGTVRDWTRILKFSGLVVLALAQFVIVFAGLKRIGSFFTTVSTFGVYLGTMALVIALSVMNGFEADLREKILGYNAHVQVSRHEGDLHDWQALTERVRRVPGVVAASPVLASEVVVAANSNYAGVVIKGIDPDTIGSVTELTHAIEHGGPIQNLWPLEGEGKPRPYTLAEGGPGYVPVVPERGDEELEDEPLDFSEGVPKLPSGPSRAAPMIEIAEELDADELDDVPLDFSGPPADASRPDAVVLEAEEIDRLDDLVIEGLDPIELEPGSIDPSKSSKPRHREEPPLDPDVAALDGILVGRELAHNLHLWVGQEVRVVSPLGQMTPAGEVPRVRRFRIAGIFYSGMYEYDSKSVYVTLPALQRFLSLEDQVDAIDIKAPGMADTDVVVTALTAELGNDYRVQDWKELNKSLFVALKLEKIAMFLVLTLIILVASFSIVSNLIMVVVEKAKEVAILKSMGATSGTVMMVFILEGTLIGGLGTVLGVLVGTGVCALLARHALPLDANVYYIDKLPVEMEPAAIVLVAFAGIAISFIATLYPSYIAARMRPVDGLRYE